jgi:signal transduction histidine kinase
MWMSSLGVNPIWRYGMAVVSTGVVTVLTLLLRPFLSHGVMALFFASVMISAWYGGLGPGLVASVLSVLAAEFFFFPPLYSFAVKSSDDVAQIVVFFIVTVLISSLTHAQKRSLKALMVSQSELKKLADVLELRVRERTSWLSLLYDITRSANEAETLGQAFRFAAHRLCEQEQWTACFVYVPAKDDRDALVLSPFSLDLRGNGAIQTGARVRRGEGPAGRCLAAATVDIAPPDRLAFPVIVGGAVIAVFECVSRQPLDSSDNLLRLMGAIGLELGQVAGRRQLQEEYADAVWQQQVRIAHELHDSLGQELTGLGFLSKSLSLSMEGTSGAQTADKLRHGIERSLEQIRGLARGVMPVERDPDGLMSALKQLAASLESVHGIPCRFDCPGPVLIPDHQTASRMYRIAQEALTNAFKHAKASSIGVSLTNSAEGVQMSIHDDGLGPPEFPEKLPAGSGLRIMRYRAAALGATLTLKKAGSQGTELLLVLPKPKTEATA